MLSRRTFLGLAGGVVLLAACGGNDDDSSSGATLPAHDHGEDELTELSPAVLSGDLYVSDTPQRFAFAMLAKEGFASQGAANLAVAPDGADPTDFVPTTLYEAGLPERRGVYVAEVVLDKEGVWDGVADREGDELPLALSELDLIVGRNFVVTHAHDEEVCAVGPVQAEAARNARLLKKGPGWIVHAVLDRLVDEYLPLVDRYDDQIEAMEVHILEGRGDPAEDPMRRVMKIKRSLQMLRRVPLVKAPYALLVAIPDQSVDDISRVEHSPVLVEPEKRYCRRAHVRGGQRLGPKIGSSQRMASHT